MNEITRVLLVEVLPRVAQKLTQFLEQLENVELIENSINNSEAAIEKVHESITDVVLLELDLPGLNGIQCTEIIRRDFPHIQVVILSEISSAETVRLAMRAGASDFINTKNITFEELSSVIERASEMARREKLQAFQRTSVAREAHIEKRTGSDKAGKVIAVYSPKGGTGVSTIAVNLAYAFRSSYSRVAVVDVNLQYGDIAVLYNQVATRSIADLAVRIQDLDEELINNVLVRNELTGVDILPAPSKPELAENIDGSTIGLIIEQMRNMFDFVIINTSSYLTDSGLNALNLCDLIILVTIQQVAAVRSTRSFLTLMKELGIMREKIMMVMNRFDPSSTITPKKVNEMVNMEVVQTIPLDIRTAERSANLGIPFTFDYKNIQISKSIYALAEIVKKQVFQDFEVPVK
ncbi:MAG: response regulator [Anaerolineaceae bacterium]|nr:response regulator [Anaerolineaceae bacterium]